MDSFTAMSGAALAATVAALPEPYEMSLNLSDMTSLLAALQMAYETGNMSDRTREWIEGFMSSVSETVGVEHI